MSEAAAIPAVNATANTGAEGSQPQGGGAEAKQPAKPVFKDKIDEVLWQVSQPTEAETAEREYVEKHGKAKPEDPVERGIAEAQKGTKDANPVPDKKDLGTGADKKPTADAPELEGGDKDKAGQKKVYTVKGKKYELTPEQADRMAQKGIFFELDNAERVKQTRFIQEREGKLNQTAQQLAQDIELLKSRPFDVLERLVGKEKARELSEGYLRPQIERELLPKEQQEALTWKERAEAAESWRQQREQADQHEAQERQAAQLAGKYESVIVDALKETGIPKTDFTAAELAAWMKRGLSKDIEYTPKQLAQFVKEDNILRTGALTEEYVKQINEAKAANDSDGIVRAGEGLAEMLGKPVVYAIGKYYLALAQRSAPNTPKQILEGPKVPVKEEKQAGPMTEDQYREERRRRAQAIDAGQDVPNW